MSRNIVKLKKQQGVALIVTLVMLLVITTSAATSISGATLQQKIAGNYRQKSQAQLNAENALRRGENWLRENVVSNADFAATFDIANNGLYLSRSIRVNNIDYGANGMVADPNDGNYFDITSPTAWLDTNSVRVGATAYRGANASGYIIEYIGQHRDGVNNIQIGEARQLVFRVTAIAWGQDPNAISILQSHYYSPLLVP